MRNLKAQLKEESETEHPNHDTVFNGVRLPLSLSERRALLLITDLFIVNVSILAGLLIWLFQNPGISVTDFILRQLFWFPILSALWLVSSVLNGFYDSRITSSLRPTMKSLIQLTTLLIIVYALIVFVSSPGSLPRRFVIYFIAISFYALAAWRLIYKLYLGKSQFQRRALIAGGENSASVNTLARVVRENPSPHYAIVGSISENSDAPPDALDEFPRLGCADELPYIVKRFAISEVIITSLENPDAGLVRSLIECQEQGMQITPIPNVYEELTGRIPLDMVQRGWLSALPLHHASTGVFFPLAKRSWDIALAIIGIAFLAIIYPFVAIALRLDSPGPIFYSQNRLGKGGKIFRTYKFRSMKVSSEDDGRAVWAEAGDARVTRVGRFLRASHIDELPQLLNILKGDMSSVGPRPERPELAAEIERSIPFYRLRHSVRPGMAGWALIHQGYSGTVQDAYTKLEYDLYYVKHQSVLLDLVILLRTFVDAASFKGR